MLVVTEEESLPTSALVASHHIDTDLLASTIAISTFIHIKAVMAIMR